MSMKQHEINIVKNVIEKAEGISERLKSWGEKMLAHLYAESDTPAPAPLQPEVAEAMTAATSGFLQAGEDLPPNSEASTSSDQPADNSPPLVPNDEGYLEADTMTADEMRATGLYPEEQIEALCLEHGVPYTAPESSAAELSPDTAVVSPA